MRGGLGLSHAVTLVLALVVTVALASIAVVGYNSYAKSVSNALKLHSGEEVSRVSEEVSIVYWVGSSLMLKNEGEAPVRIVRVFSDNVYSVDVVLNPGEKKVLTVPQSEQLALQTERGSIMKFKNPKPSVGGASEVLEITRAEANRVGDNVQIKTWVKNTGAQQIYSISISIVGEAGKAYVAPKNWLLNPGDEVQDTTALPISEYGSQYYIRVHGFLTGGGQEVSDAVWVALQ